MFSGLGSLARALLCIERYGIDVFVMYWCRAVCAPMCACVCVCVRVRACVWRVLELHIPKNK